jgi:hypothetical protein
VLGLVVASTERDLEKENPMANSTIEEQEGKTANPKDEGDVSFEDAPSETVEDEGDPDFPVEGAD